MVDEILYSSKRDDWGTPQKLFDNLNDIFQFDLDAAANEQNHKCNKWLGPGSSINKNAFDVEWNGNIFLNPPYGRKIKRWIDKAYKSSIDNDATVVCLLAARTETKFFDVCWNAKVICFIRRRVIFEGEENSAPFPSCIVVFTQKELSEDDLLMLSGEGTVVQPIYLFNPEYKIADNWLDECKLKQEVLPKPKTLG